MDAKQILDDLTTRQFLQPLTPLGDALRGASDEMGICPGAVARAIEWLNVDPDASIGRLRRTELTQLARSIERFWRDSIAKQPEGMSL